MIYRVSNEDERAVALRALKGVKLTAPYKCEIKRITRRRSLPQNALYWMWLSLVSHELAGSTKDSEVYHDYFRGKYLQSDRVTMPDGTVMDKLQSTTTLDTKQFTDYLENIRIEMIEHGINLPLPNEPGYDEMIDYYEHIAKG